MNAGQNTIGRQAGAHTEPAQAGLLPPVTGMTIGRLENTKCVSKKWGEERWLVPEGTAFAFKIIKITAGRRTSLQFHEHKEEANLVLTGEGILHLAESADDEVRTRPLTAGDIVHVRPGTVHRIEATSDITLVEVSTPELDDVVRLSDDYGRGNGRIEAEHSTTAPIRADSA